MSIYDDHMAARRSSKNRESHRISTRDLQRTLGFLNDAVTQAEDVLVELAERESKVTAARQSVRDQQASKYSALKGR